MCAAEEEIKEYIDNLEISIVYLEQYFDADSFGEDVIKYKIKERYITLTADYR